MLISVSSLFQRWFINCDHHLCHQWSSVVITGSSLVSSVDHHRIHQWSSTDHQWFISSVITAFIGCHQLCHQWSSVVIIGSSLGSSVVSSVVVITCDDTTDEHYFNVLMDVLATYTKSELLYSLADYAESTDA